MRTLCVATFVFMHVMVCVIVDDAVSRLVPCRHSFLSQGQSISSLIFKFNTKLGGEKARKTIGRRCGFKTGHIVGMSALFLSQDQPVKVNHFQVGFSYLILNSPVTRNVYP